MRAELTPVEAGRFVVYGSHDRGRVPPSRIGLEIEAAQAFGTGHHATTQGCLLALDRLAKAGFRPRRVADVGGGTGVLAMAAARLWPAAGGGRGHRPGRDGDRAGECRRRTASATRVACVTAPGLRHPRLRAGAPYDLVFANILAGPLRRHGAASSPARRRRAGSAILSGILARQAAACSPPTAAGATGRRTWWRSESGGRWCCARG